jgi:hypothetical protein
LAKLQIFRRALPSLPPRMAYLGIVAGRFIYSLILPWVLTAAKRLVWPGQ